MSIEVGSPVEGLAAPLSDVPDPVFSQAMVGPGIAVKPKAGPSDAVAPIAGKVATLHPHAFVVASDAGVAILVHLGIDTVKLDGAGFTLHVAKNEVVAAGQRIASWDSAEIESKGYASMCPVVALDAAAETVSDIRDDGAVMPGDVVFLAGG